MVLWSWLVNDDDDDVSNDLFFMQLVAILSILFIPVFMRLLNSSVGVPQLPLNVLKSLLDGCVHLHLPRNSSNSAP